MWQSGDQNAICRATLMMMSSDRDDDVGLLRVMKNQCQFGVMRREKRDVSKALCRDGGCRRENSL